MKFYDGSLDMKFIRPLIFVIIILLAPIVMLGSCAIIAWSPLLMLGAPVDLFPAQYRLVMTIHLDIDNERQTYVGEVNCTVYDQRRSIAAMPWSTKVDFPTPRFTRSGGGGVEILGIHPCKWTEERPEPGKVYQVEPNGLLFVFDDIESPTIITTMPIDAVASGAVEGVKFASMTLEAVEETKEAASRPDFPVIARVKAVPNSFASVRARANLPLETRREVQAMLTVYEITAKLAQSHPDRPCGPGGNDEWIVIERSVECRSTPLGAPKITVSDDFRQVSIDLETIDTSGARQYYYGPKIVSSAAGTYANENIIREAIFFWKPQACIGEECFELDEELGFSNLSLWNARRGQVMEITDRWHYLLSIRDN